MLIYFAILQGPARYAAGIPSSMLRPAEGVETDVIEKLDRMGKTTMTAVEREAYTQGKVENVDWLRDEEEDGAGEKKVPERTEAATEAAVPPELKCPFCGDLLVAAVLLLLRRRARLSTKIQEAKQEKEEPVKEYKVIEKDHIGGE